MKTSLAYPEMHVAAISRHCPSITIVLPFEPKMTPESELQNRLKEALAEVREKLQVRCNREQTTSILQRLNTVLNNLDFLTYKKSVAILLSAGFDRTYYLDFAVNQKIIVAEQFNLKEILHSKKDARQYLVLVLNAERSRIFLGSEDKLIRIVSNLPQSVDTFKNDPPERVGNFSDPSHLKEVLIKKFLKYTDDGLSILLQAYPLPLFVVGVDKLLGYFKMMTRNANNIVDYIHGSFSHHPDSYIQTAIAPYVANWQNVRQKDLMNRLDIANGAQKLAIGIHEVRKEAKNMNARLLVVETSYSSPIRDRVPGIFRQHRNDNIPPHIKDGVDQVIEEVIESGGDVEFVADGTLRNYDQIALIKYY